jgi:hypothetical protein
MIRKRREKRERLVNDAFAPQGIDADLEEIRCTVYVPDLIFKDYLCQLVRYQPRPSAGGPMGRAWPVNYGMIGRVWRSKKSELRSFAKPGTKPEDLLIVDYAMTEDQAHEIHRDGRSMLCILLQHEQANAHETVGVLYMDTSKEKVFGDDNRNPYSAVRQLGSSFDELLSLHSVKVLAEELANYNKELFGKAPLIEVIDA